MKTLCIKIVGESGSGLLSTGEIITKALKRAGYYLVTDREYPSVIKGGHSCYTINASQHPVHSHYEKADIMVALDRPALEAYWPMLRDGGCLLHAQEKIGGLKQIFEEVHAKGGNIVGIKGRKVAESLGGTYLMKNMILVGMLWRMLDLDCNLVEDEVKERFASKPKLLEIDLKCLKAGWDQPDQEHFALQQMVNIPDTILVSGAHALSLGAVHAGCRFYTAYPMSPSSGVLAHMAEMVKETGMVVKQAEDEISVAQMAIGAMFMGTRSLAATSGGGFDLMTESVSLAGIIENPFVIIVAQRPGPATGLPTWTCQSDLNLAIHGGHGEFARVVIGASDAEDCFELIQHAFNIAEEYQVPVIFLTEKLIMESLWTTPVFKQNTIPIRRGLVEGKDLETLQPSDRFKITDSGLSKRWIPGSSDAYYYANGDEHLEDGTLTEDAEPAKQMYDKRNRKLDLIKEALPEPEVYGPAKADISFIGWGSSRNTMRDVINAAEAEGIKVNYLHYAYLFPLKTTGLASFMETNENIHLIEGNHNGQLGEMIESKTRKDFKGRLLKYDGRPFYVNEVLDYIKNDLSKEPKDTSNQAKAN